MENQTKVLTINIRILKFISDNFLVHQSMYKHCIFIFFLQNSGHVPFLSFLRRVNHYLTCQPDKLNVNTFSYHDKPVHMYATPKIIPKTRKRRKKARLSIFNSYLCPERLQSAKWNYGLVK